MTQRCSWLVTVPRALAQPAPAARGAGRSGLAATGWAATAPRRCSPLHRRPQREPAPLPQDTQHGAGDPATALGPERWSLLSRPSSHHQHLLVTELSPWQLLRDTSMAGMCQPIRWLRGRGHILGHHRLLPLARLLPAVPAVTLHCSPSRWQRRWHQGCAGAAPRCPAPPSCSPGGAPPKLKSPGMKVYLSV